MSQAGTSAPRYLIVDDDRALAALLAEFFSGHGVEVAMAHDGSKGLALALDTNPDLVILDVMMPVLDGFEVLRQLRKRSTVPVIMLTARGDRDDRIAGLEAGADDYLPKPFDPDELLARASAVLRRSKGTPVRAAASVSVADLEVDSATRAARAGTTALDLTSLEFEILDLLTHPPGRIVSRDEISGALYQRPAAAFDRSVDVHISRLRRKLEPAKVQIRGVRGVGYVLSPSDEQEP